jgi:hypothetical protein
MAFTTERGNEPLRRDGQGTDWLRLRRINVGGNTTTALLRAQLLPVPLPPRRRTTSSPARTS